MRQSLFLVAIIVSLLNSGSLYSQTRVFFEDFEGTSLNMSSSGSATWAISTKLSAGGLKSDSTRLINPGDSSFLSSNVFSTNGFNNVIIKFKHICKLEFFDGGFLQVSIDNGLSWTTLNNTHYRGQSTFGSIGERFNSFLYIDWNPTNIGAIPNNSWWKTEVFDISSFASNKSQLKIRFLAKDLNNNGGLGTYGWLIDDVEIYAGNNELVPPSITLMAANPVDSAAGTGPFLVNAMVSDSSGISAVYLHYSAGMLNDSVLMSRGLNNVYSAYIPSFPYQTLICYRVSAKDSAASQNRSVYPEPGCISFYNYKDLVQVQVGNSLSSGFHSPMYNGTATSADKYSQHISIFTPADIAMKGIISKLAWRKADGFGYINNDGKLKIYMKHTSIDSISQAAGTFATQLNGATLVYNDSLQNLLTVEGWQNFTFNISNFSFNGVSNLMILVDWYHPGSLTGSNPSWNFTNKSGKAITFFGSAPNPTTTAGAGSRPNTLFYINQQAFNYDLAPLTISNPAGNVVSSVLVPVKTYIKNTGAITLHKANIHWSVNGNLQTPVLWTGNLQTDQVSQEVTLGNYLFINGINNIKVWTSLPNDSADQNIYNDTISFTFYACNQILSGVYTVGTPASDFPLFSDLMTALNICGISGPVEIKIMPGIYNTQILLTDSIPGISAINTLKFTSYTGDPASVTLRYMATTATSNYIIGLKGAKFCTIEKLTLQSLGASLANVVVFSSRAQNNIISECIIKMPLGVNIDMNGIVLSEKSSYNLIRNNKIYDGYSSIRTIGNSTTRSVNNSIENNHCIKWAKYGLYLNYDDSTMIRGNSISSDYVSTSLSIYGIGTNYNTNLRILNNKILMTLSGPGYGIYYNYTSDNPSSPSLIANNFISLSGSSTNSANHCIYYSSSNHTRIYHNSLANYIGSSNATAINFEGNCSGVHLKNNSIANFNGGLALMVYSAATGAFSSSNYNNYFTTGSTLAKWATSTLVPVSGGIAALTALSQKDSNSILSNPMYYSNINLHSFSQTMNNAGTPLAEVTADIDGEVRSATTPDIGADEYSLAANDAGLLSFISPLASDTQNRQTIVKAIIRNFGTAPITSVPVSYRVNNGPFQSTTWNGNLSYGQSDTVSLPAFTIPALDYTITAYTHLSADLLKANDTIKGVFYGMPLINAELSKALHPVSGCDPGTQPLKIRIKKVGLNSIGGSLNVGYSIVGGTNVINETINLIVPLVDSLDYTFTNPINFSAPYDSVFLIKIWINHTSDPVTLNDTIWYSVLSVAPLTSPVVNDTTVAFASSAQLTAISQNPVEWYTSLNSLSPVGSGNVFNTPVITDTTTYYVQSNTNLPAKSLIIGTQNNVNGQYQNPSPYSGQAKQQYLYLASELLAAGYTGGAINSLAFYTETYFGSFTQFEVSIGPTTLNAVTATFSATPAQLVYSGTIDPQPGWNDIIFTTQFNWDGSSNILVHLQRAPNTLISPAIQYTITPFNSCVFAAGIGAINATTGAVSPNRPNIRFKTKEVIGCRSAKVPVRVNIIPPQKDVKISSVVSPQSGCGLISTPVSIKVVNHGLDTIFGGVTARYRINNGAFTTPEVINATILPWDTLLYTFSTLASLPSGPSLTKYRLTAVVNMPGDLYLPNDTLQPDSIASNYTPASITPLVQNIPYGSIQQLNISSSDTLYWYTQSSGGLPVKVGSPFITPPLYDTTSYFVEARKTSGVINTQIGTGVNSNNSYSYPTPYGALLFGARQQFLITAAELSAAGWMKNQIRSIGFNVIQSNSVVLEDYSIRLGHTTQTDLTYFEPNLTTVFSASFYTPVNGQNTHQLMSPFLWDGVSNLVVETCFKNPSNGTLAQVQNSITSFISSILYTAAAGYDCGNSSIVSSGQTRPNIYFSSVSTGACASNRAEYKLNVTGIPAVDASVISIIEPVNQAANGVLTNVKAVIINRGTTTLSSTPIHYAIDNQSPAVYNYTGNLSHNQVDTISLGQVIFTGGLQKLRVWTAKTGDGFAGNDTATAIIKVCMNGVYTVGNGKTYASFNEALATVTQTGVCGNVEFVVDSGLYNGALVIPAIPGTGPNAWVSFRSQSNDSTYVVLSASVSAASPHVIKLQSASYIRFKGISISANGSTNGYTIQMEGSTNNIEILNCVINSVASTTSGAAATVYSGSTSIRNILIRSCVMRYGYNTVHLNGASSLQQKRVSIENNYLTGFYQCGVYAYYQDSLKISGNTMVSDASSQYYFGIRAYYGTNSLDISNNKMQLYATSYSYGIELGNYSGSVSNYGMIYNNMISCLNGTGTNAAIYLSSTNYVRVVYNSILLGGVSTTNRGIFMGTGSNNTFLNNNISIGSGYVFYTTNPGSVSAMDNNNYFVGANSTGFAYWGGPIATFAAFKAYDPTKNIQSVNFDPIFNSATDLHTGNVMLNAKAVPISGVITDIDGQVRNATNPDIGADEIFPAPYDILAYKVVKPFATDCGYSSSDSIIVRIINGGTSDLNFSTHPLTVKAIISGQVTDTVQTVLNSGTLLSAGILDIIVSSNYNFSAKGAYSIKAVTLMTVDTVLYNNNTPIVNFISLPTISSFPYNEDFESGNNLTFNEFRATDAGIAVNSNAASSGAKGLHFTGGGFSTSYNSATTVDLAFANTTKITKAFTCNVNPGSNPFMNMKFDLKQTFNTAGNPNTSWFRVMITNTNGTMYLKNSNGDSTFKAVNTNTDPFITQVFNLTPYLNQSFTISLEAVNRLAFGTGSFSGDNVFVDNFSLWVPNQTDLAVAGIIEPASPFKKAGESMMVKVKVSNFGTDTITSIPLTYVIGNLAPVNQTFAVNLLPSQSDTLSFSTSFVTPLGMNLLKVYSTVAGDVIQNNDTLTKAIRGLATFQPPYNDGYEGNDEWIASGTNNQWQRGVPSTATINAAHGGTNVWATLLSQNYITASTEYLYSPYFTIPVFNDTVVLGFWQWMKVFPNKAYGALQYTLNQGLTWASMGFIASPEAGNWYNTNINGFHCWSSTNSNWIYSYMKLDPAIFNTGNPVQFRFAFIAESYQFNDEGWAIDDFSLTLPQIKNDAGLSMILSPASQTVTADLYQPMIVVKNHGTDTLNSIPVAYKINNQTAVVETLTVNLLPDSTAIYVFSTPYTAPATNYTFCAFTALVADPIHQNDTLCMQVIALPGKKDAGIVSIEAPLGQSTTNASTTVKVKVKNFGSDTLTSLPLLYKLNSSVMANEIWTGILLPDSTADFTFATSYISPVGIYTLCAETNLSGDVNPLNNSKCEQITGTGIENLNAQDFRIEQNIPNPSNDVCFIDVYVPTGGKIILRLYNANGKIIKHESMSISGGRSSIKINTTELPQGLYLYSIEYSGLTLAKKMLVNH